MPRRSHAVTMRRSHAMAMRRPRTLRVLALLAAASFASCMRPAQPRAERDLEVGSARAAAIDVRVEEGLAAVRGIDVDAGVVRLWASAPSLRVHLTAHGAARKWTLAIDNTFADATA